MLEKQKCNPYLVRLTKKFTYYDKWELNGIYTIIASNTKNIIEYFFLIKNSTDTIDEILEGLDEGDRNKEDRDKEDSQRFENILQKIKTLKTELEKFHKKISVIEYNKKKAIFKYLQRLDKNDKEKMNASMEATKIVFINADSYKAIIIHKQVAYWLETGNFPPIYHEKYQKTIWLIDDEDIANRCKTQIRA